MAAMITSRRAIDDQPSRQLVPLAAVVVATGLLSSHFAQARPPATNDILVVEGFTGNSITFTGRYQCVGGVGRWDQIGNSNHRIVWDWGVGPFVIKTENNYYHAAGPNTANDPTGDYTASSPYGAGLPFVYIEGDKCTKEDPNPGESTDTEVGDPINTITGNVSHDTLDFMLSCPGLPLVFSRGYQSQSDYAGPLGSRWTHSLNWLLAPTTTVTGAGLTNYWQILQTGAGRLYSFQSTNNTVWTRPPEKNWELQTNSGGYRLTLPRGIWHQFDTNGVLTSMNDLWGNALTLTYSNAYPNHLLTNLTHSIGQSMVFAYNSSNWLSQIDTSSSDFSLAFSYDNDGNLTSATRCCSEAGTNVTTYAYDASGNLTQRVNAVGDTFNWWYDAEDRATNSVVGTNYYQVSVDFSELEDELRSTICCMACGSPVREMSRVYPHEPQYREVAAVTNESAGVVRHNTFDGNGNLTNQTLSEGASQLIVKRTFDAYHQVTSEGIGFNAAPSDLWAYTWDAGYRGLVTKITDPEDHEIEYVYTNALTAEVRLGASSPHVTEFFYTTNGLLAAVTNANGHGVSYEYDSSGFMTKLAREEGVTVNFSNTVFGHLKSIHVLSDEQDTNDPPAYIARLTTFDTDELGRVRAVTYADDLGESFSYDAVGNMTQYVDRAGRTNVFEYLPASHCSAVYRELDGQTITNSCHYDTAFNLLELYDAKGRTVESYTLDLDDRTVAVTNLEGQGMSLEYYVGEYVKSIRRFDGTSITNTYDSDGRLSSVKYEDETVSLTHYKNNLVKTAANPAGTITWTYDQYNRLAAVTNAVPAANGVSYTHHPAGQVSNMVSVAGTTTYLFDPAERLSLLAAPNSTFQFGYYTNAGTIYDMTCTNTGLRAWFCHDDLDRITGIVWMDQANSNALMSFGYHYSPAGMITNVSRETGEKISYSYDELDRLTGELHRDAYGVVKWSLSNDYDVVGNPEQRHHQGLSLEYTCTNGDRLVNWALTDTNLAALADLYVAADEAIGTNRFLGQLWLSNTYAVTPEVDGTNLWYWDMIFEFGSQQVVAAVGDTAGNVSYVTNTFLLAVITNAAYQYSAGGCLTNATYTAADYGKVVALGWNERYELTDVSVDGTLVERYGYDALGRRVFVSDGAATNYFVHDRIHVVAEVCPTGTLQRSYTWGPGVDNLLAMTDHTGTNPVTYYFLTDHLGTVHAAVNEAGTIVELYRYDAWGRVLGVYDAELAPLEESAIGNPYLFHGRWYSWRLHKTMVGSGLYFFRARWYDPLVGRWLSKDPIGISGGLNQYMFCRDNPVMFRDCLGLYSEQELIQAAADVTMGLIGRAAQMVALQSGNIDAWRRIENQREVLGVQGQKTGGKHAVVIEWENTTEAKLLFLYGQRKLTAAYLRGASELEKKIIKTEYEILRQSSALRYIENLLKEAREQAQLYRDSCEEDDSG